MIFLCSHTVNVFVDLPDRWDFFSSMWENKTVINIYIFFTLNTESILYVMLAVQQIKQIRLVGSLQCPSNDARRALQHIPTTRRKKKLFFVPVPLSLSCFFCFFFKSVSHNSSVFSLRWAVACFADRVNYVKIQKTSGWWMDAIKQK